MKARHAVIKMEAGIGDSAHAELALAYLLNNGFSRIDLFVRRDAMGLYANYDGVTEHWLDAKAEYIKLCMAGGEEAIIGTREHSIPDTHRAVQYANSLARQHGLPLPGKDFLRTPRLPVTPSEVARGEAYFRGEERLLFQVDSSRISKSLPLDKANSLLRKFVGMGMSVVVLTQNPAVIYKHPKARVANNLTIRQLMGIAAAADYTLAMDSAPAWISCAVGTRTTVLFGATNPIYYAYHDPLMHVLMSDHVSCIMCEKKKCDDRICLASIPDDKIARVAIGQESSVLASLAIKKRRSMSEFCGISIPHAEMPMPLVDQTQPVLRTYSNATDKKPENIALLRLDGMGGTMTLADQAKKVKSQYPEAKVTLIIRHYGILFQDNPYVDEVIEMGMASWQGTLEAAIPQYDALADLRFAVARWYGETSVCKGSYEAELYHKFPLGQRALDQYQMHHIQLCDMQLGLPYDTIEVEMFFPLPPNELAGEYVVINTGVDTVHSGLIQTKCWQHWSQLVDYLGDDGIPVVQVGTSYDGPVKGALDCRGKTSIPVLCSILKGALASVFTEGGLMHLSYALKCENTVILRGPTASPLLAYPGQTLVDSYTCRSCMFSKGDWFRRCPMGMIDPVCMKSISPERVVNIVENMVTSKRAATV